jgi:hypothetical protein
VPVDGRGGSSQAPRHRSRAVNQVLRRNDRVGWKQGEALLGCWVCTLQLANGLNWKSPLEFVPLYCGN